ncbi:MAG: FtsX-like permease family protein, partial [Bacteroidota bacterium]
LIFLWVSNERSMDKFHVNGEDIFQLFRNMKQSTGLTRTTISIPKPAADLMQEEYPEVDQIALLSWSMGEEFTEGDKKLQLDGHYASPEFLDIFSFPLLVGEKSSALSELNNILISRTLAENFFGSSWKGKVLGSTISVNDAECKITGVFENTPDNSTIQFDWLRPATSFFNRNEWVNDWGNGSFRVYFTLSDRNKADVVADRILNVINENAAGNSRAGNEQLILHKFQDYYLYSNFTNGVVDGGRITYVKLLTIVAILILIIASVNFVNLSTARSGRRSKEIGLRKVMGAHKSSISTQFLMESVLFTALAVILSVLAIWLILPFFNQLVNKQLTIDFNLPITWIYAFGITLTVGLLSGIYPALLLSTYSIINSLKGSARKSSNGVTLRKLLVVLQFGISVLLIIGVSVVYSQLDYALTKDLGLNKDNLISVELDSELDNHWQTLKTEILKFPNVTAVSVASGNPLTFNRSTSSASWERKDPNEGYEVNIMLTDKSFVETMEIEVIKGRDFSSQLQDSTSFLINEVAAELMGFDDPIDKKLSFWDIEGRVIGVIKNYHMQDMHEAISPLIISCVNPSYSDVVLIRVDGPPGEVLKSTEDLLKSMSPIYEFNYEFVDEAYAESYEIEFLISRLIQIFAGISIFLSCLGLFGLSAFTAEQRTKEIGIRKVHGASVKQLVLLLSKDYAKLMIIAFIIAIPFGYYYSQQWLTNFEFRTTIKPILFVISGGLIFIVGALTVSFKSLQAAKTNPVNTLKDE